MLLYSVYGNLRQLSKSQIRIWARIAYAERDLFFFALPASVTLCLGALAFVIGRVRLTHLIAQSLPYLGSVVVVFFIWSMARLSHDLQFKAPPRWTRFFVALSQSFISSLRQFRVFTFELIHRLPQLRKYSYLSHVFRVLPVALLLSLAFVILKLSRMEGDDLPTANLIALFLSAEAIMQSWRRHGRYAWFDLVAFSGDLELLVSSAMQLALAAGIVTAWANYLLFQSATLALSVVAAWLFSVFFCFYCGSHSAIYQRVFFLIAQSFAFAVSVWHPLLFALVIWLLLANMERAVEQARINYLPELYPL